MLSPALTNQDINTDLADDTKDITFEPKRVVCIVPGLAYNQRETRYKRLSGRDPDRTWCHLHTNVKFFRSQPLARWTSSAAYECAAIQSMDPWPVIKKALD